MRTLLITRLAILLALAACGAPDAARVPISEEARAAPPPMLGPTASFDSARAEAGPAADELRTDAATLAARADALRVRAGGLGGPVVDPAVRPRLEAATAAAGQN